MKEQVSLIEGVKVYIDYQEAADRIRLSQGSVMANDQEYHEKSYIPIDKWRKPSPVELDMLIASKTQFSFEKYNKSIGVYKLSDEIIDICNSIGFNSIDSRAEFYEKFNANPDNFYAFQEKISEFISNLKLDAEYPHRVHMLPILSNSEITLTKAFDSRTSKFLLCGLHIDGDSGQHVHNCPTADNRISINLTSEKRTVFYINVSVDELIGKHSNKFSIDAYDIENRNTLVENFFLKNPTYPVVAIDIQPYELYVAPTDNIIHDGSIRERRQKDVTLVIMGKFLVSK